MNVFHICQFSWVLLQIVFGFENIWGQSMKRGISISFDIRPDLKLKATCMQIVRVIFSATLEKELDKCARKIYANSFNAEFLIEVEIKLE